MRTLVVSDLHLGSVTRRDVLRRPVALDALLTEVERADRLVLNGDVVELLEGRPAQALDAAVEILAEIGAAVPEVVVLAGNHDHALVAPWLRRRRDRGVRPLGIAERVPRDASPALERVCAALRPAKVSVRYPGMWVAPGVYATHGHYLDCLLVRGMPGQPPPENATPEQFERAPGPSTESLLRVLGGQMSPRMRDSTGAAAGALRRATLTALPLVLRLPALESVAPAGSGVLGHRLGSAGVAAMNDALGRLGISARHVLFGHIHRAGPLPDDDAEDWRPGRARLWNSGSWVLDPLLLGGAADHHDHPHPYWPGRAIAVEEGRPPELLRLLDHAPIGVLAGA